MAEAVEEESHGSVPGAAASAARAAAETVAQLAAGLRRVRPATRAAPQASR